MGTFSFLFNAAAAVVFYIYRRVFIYTELFSRTSVLTRFYSKPNYVLNLKCRLDARSFYNHEPLQCGAVNALVLGYLSTLYSTM